MRRHAKAADAGSTKRRAKTKPALLACALAACVAALALVVGSASGSTTRFLQETFGSSAQPSFPADRGIAVDQSTNEVYVLDATEDTLYRYNADGSASNFGALGSNAIDGEGSGDETPQVGLSIPSNRKESQIAIDESGTATDGDIYVAGGSAHRVDIFSSAGEYKGQLTEYSGGALGETCGVAVDGSGNVYVGDYSHGVHVYEPAANPPVNGDNTATFTTAANPCTMAAGTGATEGFLFVDRYNGELLKLDAATGEVKYTLASGGSTVSVDPSNGHVFSARNTGGSSTIDEYDASGASEASLASSFKPGSTAEGVAANGASEEVYVSRSSTENVEVYGATKVIPDVVTEAPSSNTGYRATLAGSVNPDGVELDECFFEWGKDSSGEYTETTPCAETPAEIGTGTSPVAVHADISGLIPQGPLVFGGSYRYRLVAKNPNATINGSNQTFSTPNTVTAEAASGIAPTEATLNGSVNPDTATLSECLFEWGPEKQVTDAFQPFPEGTPCAPGPGGITGESPVAVHADLSGLHPGTTYVYRLRVAYPSATIVNPRKDQTPLSLQTTGPVVDGSWAQGVTFTEASLRARINPEGSATTYHFEYGETTAYGSQTEELNVGSDSSFHAVSRFLTGLSPGTTYHYRVLATDGPVTNEGPDHTLTTFVPLAADTGCGNRAVRYGASANLPDCRAYEMVSPVEKEGADIISRGQGSGGNSSGTDQSALDGNKLTYSSYKAFGDTQSALFSNQYMATRGDNGWTTHGINPPHKDSVNPFGLDTSTPAPEFTAFNGDLSLGYLYDDNKPTLLPDAVEGHDNLYQRDNLTGEYKTMTLGPLSWPAPSFQMGPPTVMAHADDGEHVVFTATGGLTPDAPHNSKVHLYEYIDGAVRLVSILPNGEPASDASFAGNAVETPGDNESAGLVTNAVSEDGSRIFWTDRGVGTQTVFVRVDGTTTVPVSGSVGSGNATFLSASADGSKAIFLAYGKKLFVFDVDTETSHLIAERSSGILGASDDAESVYFISRNVLDAGAENDQENVYLAQGGSVHFIGTVARADVGEGYGDPSIASDRAGDRFTRVTSDGRYLLFQSRASLTGYDNRSINNGEPAREIYRYDAVQDQLRCISCNPSGARPTAAALPKPYTEGTYLPTVWAAAWINTARRQTYFARVALDDGSRVFFNSFDALVPSDTNGAQDVYQWEAAGAGDCTTTSSSYSPQDGGCLSLISPGTSSEPSEFIDASQDGADVFFRTKGSIDPRDEGLIDIYDAREGGGFPPPAAPPNPCLGDACQKVPQAPQANSLSSSVFHGAGNANPVSTRSCARPARRAQKLSRRAKRLRSHSESAKRSGKSAIARKRSKKARRLAKRAMSKSKNAKRCRRARHNRRAHR